MATTIEDIVVRFKTQGVESLKTAKGAVADLKNDISDFGQVGGPLQNTLNGIIGKLGPIGIAAGAAGSAFVLLGSQALRLSGELEDVAGATGITTGKIDNFANSLIFAGGKASDAGSILGKLNQSVQALRVKYQPQAILLVAKLQLTILIQRFIKTTEQPLCKLAQEN
jgi:hypothetical protein